ncbi:hypothetical protein GF406_00940 [candidate division KSB1 bacterium]|nr:hypothetical protein [candidate division KSB1 bacterium]
MFARIPTGVMLEASLWVVLGFGRRTVSPVVVMVFILILLVVMCIFFGIPRPVGAFHFLAFSPRAIALGWCTPPRWGLRSDSLTRFVIQFVVPAFCF